MELPIAHSTDLLTGYKRVRAMTEEICQPLSPEDYVVQPVVDVSPPKWHLAHTTWFFETFLLQKHKPEYKVFDPDFNFLFNSYYESVGERVIRADRGNLTRPGVSEIFDYRAYVDQAMEAFLEQLTDPSDEILQVLEIGLNHEQQHQELLITDLKYILGHNPLFPVYQEHPQQKEPEILETDSWLSMEEGVYEIGHNGKGFCFDNELGLHRVLLPAYQVMSRLVTCGEYLEFINDGGYQDFKLWMMEGWEWVNREQIKAPLYWHLQQGQWFHYDLSGLQPVKQNQPVTHISFFEADAYARWSGKRLPSEFEWEAACKHHQPSIPDGARFQDHKIFMPGPAKNYNLQFYGDAWEWTGSAYRPYPYYKQAPGALGEYNGKFMINQMVLRGGSCATPKDHIRATYRNFFHPHLRWQYTGIRLASHA